MSQASAMNSVGPAEQQQEGPEAGAGTVKLEVTVKQEAQECVVCGDKMRECFDIYTTLTPSGASLHHFLAKYTQVDLAFNDSCSKQSCKSCYDLMNVLERTELEYMKLKEAFEAIISKNPLFEVSTVGGAAPRELPDVKCEFDATEDSEDEPLARRKSNRLNKTIKKKKKGPGRPKRKKSTDKNSWECEECGVRGEEGGPLALAAHKITVHTEIAPIKIEDGSESPFNNGNDSLLEAIGFDDDDDDEDSNFNPDEFHREDKKKVKKKPMERKKPKVMHACDQCNSRYSSLARLEAHKAKHDGSKPPYICEVCGAHYKHKRACDIHIALHKGISDWKCEECNKLFPSKNALQRHNNIHTGKLNYQTSRMTGSKPTTRGSSWDEDSLRRAMAAVQNNLLSTNAAALKFNIPRRTLRNHLLSGNSSKTVGKGTVLTDQLEEDLSQRIKRFAKLGIPLTPEFIQKQAFLFCERFKIKHTFNTSTRMAGRKWLKRFLARNPSITQKKPQLMKPARGQQINKPIVKHRFEEVKKLYEELDIMAHPQRLYKMDEEECHITVHEQSVVLADRGDTGVNLVGPELADDVTVAKCANAVGMAVPPLIIFKGITDRPELSLDLPPGTKIRMSPEGNMTSSLFVEFIQHLARHKVQGKCLLVFDGATCHLTYEALEEADKSNIVLYYLPSHTNRSFEHHWDEEISNYLCYSSERTLNEVAFNNIFSQTWSKCMTQSNIMNGFKDTGLYPLDPDMIPEDAYASFIVTERPLPEQNQIDQPFITVQVSPPASELNEVSELSSQSLIDERSAHVSRVSSIIPSTSEKKIASTTSKLSAATKKRKPVVASYSSSTDASDLELDNTISDQCGHILLSSAHRHRLRDADMRHDPRPSRYDNPVQTTSGLQEDIVCSSSESDLD